MKRLGFSRAETGWLASEFAGQPYFTLINTFLFANYFANTLSPNALEGQAYWGYTQAVAGGLIAILSPVFGAIADASGRRKPWVGGFVAACAIACVSLWWAQPGGQLLVIALAVVIAAATIEFAITFTNAMLADLATGRRVGLLSGVGFGTSQLAGILSLVVVLIAFQLPGRVEGTLIPEFPLFGLDHATHETERVAGPVAGLWLVVFMLPLFVMTPDRRSTGVRGLRAAAQGLTRLCTTVGGLRRADNATRFLIARMFYNDGMQAMFAFGGVIAGAVLGWGALELAVFGIAVTLCAGIGGFAGAAVDGRVGSRATIAVSLLVVTLTACALVTFEPGRLLMLIEFAPRAEGAPAFSSPSEWVFMATACLFGTAIGPVIASSRTLMARLAPEGQVTEYFGLYALSGKATAFAAPLAIALLTSLSGSRMIGLAVIVVFLIAGFLMLLSVRDDEAEQG